MGCASSSSSGATTVTLPRKTKWPVHGALSELVVVTDAIVRKFDGDKTDSEYIRDLDKNTKFWIRLCREFIDPNLKFSALDVDNITKKIKLPQFPVEVGGRDVVMTFTDNDEDLGNLDETAIQMLLAQTFFSANSLPQQESDKPSFFPSIKDAMRAGEHELGKVVPRSEVFWEDFRSDQAVSNLAFYGLGQIYLTKIRSTQAVALPDAVCEIDLSFLAKYKTRKSFEKYGCIAYFGPKKRLLAIYWCLKGELIYPGEPDWDHCKFVFRSSLGTAVTVKDHLVNVHWVISNSMIFATRESLGMYHPLRRLLKPHTYEGVSVNWSSKQVLLPQDGLAFRVFALDAASFTQAVRDSFTLFQYETFPDFIAKKQLPGVLNAEETIPLVTDGLAIWRVIRKYVDGYLSIFYADDASVQADGEVVTYWEHYETTPGGSYKLPALTKESLVDQVTHCIFWTTAGHELVGAVSEYLLDPSGLGPKILPNACQSDKESYFQALVLIALTGLRKPMLINDWSHIHIHSELAPERVAPMKRVIESFQEDLKALSKRIDALNSTAADAVSASAGIAGAKNNRSISAEQKQPLGRGRKFMAMNPRVLEVSVSV